MIRYLSTRDVADRLGLAHGTITRYEQDGRLPEPDATIGLGDRHIRGWLPETIDTWQAHRPGRGARTDLHPH